ncbi:putative toxin-antitoxin system toxin component, PIN family [Thiomicrospira microaerophila]|uniref:putative toxin-antitoxin system toxin component, PIN family n=1 Tax=Thiomicrospira microaerophila TaxID=406020 RepID=UPI00200D6995|nr:putative toxin-antitoxin system toxin component, PIN family [Thiomicrospira microaerophila]UQB41533.1 putative toxin-antitoxin system toxin component, PIN family [Thiomicrospira microaerophila]
MKIVCDTNVWLSALTSNQGASHVLVKWLFQQSSQLHSVSTPFIMELEDVLLRPKNRERMPQFSEQDLRRFIDDICCISNRQPIYFLWRPLIKDPKDDMVLELAVNAQAEYLISFNIQDFKAIEGKFNFTLCTPKAFLQQQGVLK